MARRAAQEDDEAPGPGRDVAVGVVEPQGARRLVVARGVEEQREEAVVRALGLRPVAVRRVARPVRRVARRPRDARHAELQARPAREALRGAREHRGRGRDGGRGVEHVDGRAPAAAVAGVARHVAGAEARVQVGAQAPRLRPRERPVDDAAAAVPEARERRSGEERRGARARDGRGPEARRWAREGRGLLEQEGDEHGRDLVELGGEGRAAPALVAAPQHARLRHHRAAALGPREPPGDREPFGDNGAAAVLERSAGGEEDGAGDLPVREAAGGDGQQRAPAAVPLAAALEARPRRDRGVIVAGVDARLCEAQGRHAGLAIMRPWCTGMSKAVFAVPRCPTLH